MLHVKTIEPKTLDILKRLQMLPLFENTRLVGGTALALQLGHRKSIDIDLFGTIEDLPDILKEYNIKATFFVFIVLSFL